MVAPVLARNASDLAHIPAHAFFFVEEESLFESGARSLVNGRTSGGCFGYLLCALSHLLAQWPKSCLVYHVYGPIGALAQSGVKWGTTQSSTWATVSWDLFRVFATVGHQPWQTVPALEDGLAFSKDTFRGHQWAEGEREYIDKATVAYQQVYETIMREDISSSALREAYGSIHTIFTVEGTNVGRCREGA